MYLPSFKEYMRPKKEDLYNQWESAGERERRSHTMFAQVGIKIDEVAKELEVAREAVGLGVEVAGFVKQSLEANKAVVSGDDPMKVDLAEVPRALKDLLSIDEKKFEAIFSMPIRDEQIYLTRTRPLVENLPLPLWTRPWTKWSIASPSAAAPATHARWKHAPATAAADELPLDHHAWEYRNAFSSRRSTPTGFHRRD